MAITKSAKKAIVSSEKKRVYNLRRRRAIQTVEKDIAKLLKAELGEESQLPSLAIIV
jgi:ribosomal protein S20